MSLTNPVSNTQNMPAVEALQASQPQHTQVDYSTHPALTPPTDHTKSPFLDLADYSIAQILFLANDPHTRHVCRRFAQIEDILMPEMDPKPTDNDEPQKKRLKIYQRVKEIRDALQITPAAKHSKSAHDLFLSGKSAYDVFKVAVGDYPLTVALASDRQLTLDVPPDQLDAVKDKWLLEHRDSCSQLTFMAANFLPTELQNMPCLRTLTIMGATFTELPSWFYTLPIMRLLIISSPSSLISAKIAEMKSLEFLAVMDCNVTAIPPELASLPNLKKALFKKTCIQEVPETLKTWETNGTVVVGDYSWEDFLLLLRSFSTKTTEK